MSPQETRVIDLSAPPANSPRLAPRRSHRLAPVLALSITALGVLPGEPTRPTPTSPIATCDRQPDSAKIVAAGDPAQSRVMVVVDSTTGKVVCSHRYPAR
ncbi:hypothetical protein [Micromonospora fluostatini]|uniref:hypothetical protein n=1 Tax=Micromonospora sp. JCM 30529 TaxID=3421643 RepID=UPI003D163826